MDERSLDLPGTNRNKEDTLRSFHKKYAFALVASVLAFTGLHCMSGRAERPNIVYILADDMGFGDVSVFNTDGRINTPFMDKLATQGMRFTDAHSPSAVCTPTRYGILTGRFAWRTEMKSGVLWSWSKPLIEQDRMTVATLLKQKNYATAAIGKWHLGLGWQYHDDDSTKVDFTKTISDGPTTLGFDYFFGITASLDIPPYVYIENDSVTAQPDRKTENKDWQGFWRLGDTGSDFDHENVLPKLTEKAVSFIENQNSAKPFFLYFALPAPHTPILPTADFKGKSNTNLYGDFVQQTDWTVGQVMKALKKKGLEKNTIFIVTSDNGVSPRANFDELKSVGHNSSGIYRGHKADIYEGGHRVPFIVRWPARVRAGSVSDETINLADLFATSASVVGAAYGDDAGEDSYSILPLLLGRKDAIHREATVHHSINGSFAIRKGKWKLVMCPGSGGWSSPKPGRETEGLPPFQLFDLQADPAETNSVYEANPKVVDDLRALLVQYIKEGRSTPGLPQQNSGGTTWKQLKWMHEGI